jgi:hypothetical protein
MIDEYLEIQKKINIVDPSMNVYYEIIPQDADLPSCAIRQMPNDEETRINCNKLENVYSILFRVEHTPQSRLDIHKIFTDLKDVLGFRTSFFNSVYRDEQNNFYYEFTLKTNF